MEFITSARKTTLNTPTKAGIAFSQTTTPPKVHLQNANSQLDITCLQKDNLFERRNTTQKQFIVKNSCDENDDEDGEDEEVPTTATFVAAAITASAPLKIIISPSTQATDQAPDLSSHEPSA